MNDREKQIQAEWKDDYKTVVESKLRSLEETKKLLEADLKELSNKRRNADQVKLESSSTTAQNTMLDDASLSKSKDDRMEFLRIEKLIAEKSAEILI